MPITRITRFLACLCACAGIAVSAPVGYHKTEGTIYNYKAASGNWKTASAWSHGIVPSGRDYGDLRGTKNVVVDSAVPEVESCALGETGQTSTLSVKEGGKLLLGRSLWVPTPHRKDAGGCLRLEGGEITTSLYPDMPGGKGLLIGVSITHSGAGIATFSGGTYCGAICVGNTAPNSQTGTLAVVGSATCIKPPAAKVPLIVRPSGNLLFILDKDGVSTLDFSKSMVQFDAGSRIFIDGSAYAGGAKTIPLARGAKLFDKGAKIEVSGFSGRAEAFMKSGKDPGLYLRIAASGK